MVGPYEGLSLVNRNRFGSRCTHFSGRLRRRFWLEYRVHGRPHEFKRDAKRFLSLTLVGQALLIRPGRDELSLARVCVFDAAQASTRYPDGTPDEQELVRTEEKRFPRKTASIKDLQFPLTRTRSQDCG